MSTAVIIPALNEEAALPGVLARLPAGVRVIVADNGSTDRTGEVARTAGAEVVHQPRRGYGSAVQAGLAHLTAEPPEVVVILDADGGDAIEELDRLVQPIRADRADFVLADRSSTAQPGALMPAQRIGNALAVRLIHRACGHRYRDLGPFRALRWTCARALDLSDPDFGWNVEMQLKAVHHGLRILEIPLPYSPRRAGRSKISGTLIGTLRAGTRILLAVRMYA